MRWIATAIVALAFAGSVDAQGKGNEKGKGQDKSRGGVVKENRQSVDRGQGKKDVVQDVRSSNRGRGPGNARGRSDERIVISEVAGVVEPVTVRTLVLSPRRGNREVGRAIASAASRGASDDLFLIQPIDNRVRVLNNRGDVLVDWDDDRELGNWKVVTTPFADRRDAPSFCRSGAGHPVWGRQWCVEKGFGLGVDEDVRWARIVDPRDVMIARPTTGDLTRDVLVGVLGDIVLNRFATHAITLGWQEPLTGRWLGDPSVSGPRVLLVSSGARPVAEVVDLNADDRADLVVVAVRPR